VSSVDDLRRILNRIDGRGYKAYRDTRGAFDFGDFTLHVDHVQGDPFAAPSKLRARVPQRCAELPRSLFENAVRRTAFEDFLARRVRSAIRGGGAERRGSGKSGLVSVDAGAQEVLERTAVVVRDDWVEVRLQAGLPAAGRRVLGRQAEAMLCGSLPEIVEAALTWSGASDRPLRGRDAIAFRSPESLRVVLSLANPIPGPDGPCDSIGGMGVRKGVTLIVGGGYHGKSTLLRALERGVYSHVPEDGRECVVSDRDLVKIRAEDGRRVEQVDISAFIGDLPQGRSTTAFSSDDASGSTSQAANIVEAIEAGAAGMLLDEDTSATNFMVRDARMQALVHKEHEPITPFLERVREIYDKLGVSTVLVMGGCGDYFDVADTVIVMREFRPFDATDEARTIAAERSSGRRTEARSPLTGISQRIPLAESFDPSRGRRDVKIDAKALDHILFGSDAIDLRSVEQLVDLSQTRAVGDAIHLAAERFMDGEATLHQVIGRLEEFFDRRGLDELNPFHRAEHHPGNYARPRRFEIAAAINRLRTVRMRQRANTP
jgi:predicted ABC-class ATPase